MVPFSQTRLRRARKTVRLEPPMSASIEARIAEHAAAPTPPLPISSPPLPLPSPLTTSPTNTGGYGITDTWDKIVKAMLEVAPTTLEETQLTTTLGRIETLEARDLEPQDGPAEAGSSC
ncbi:hypothetical protein Tco_1545928 [Tanacetum coccineum]